MLRGRSGRAGADGRPWNAICGRASRTRSAPATTASGRTSRCSPRSPSASSCACSTSAASEQRLDMTEVDGYVWHCFLPGDRPRAALRLPRARAARPGDRPALQPDRSCCIDPYATGDRRRGHAGTPPFTVTRSAATTGSATTRTAPPFVPRSVVTNPWFEWGDDRQLRIPWHETVLYECHVKGLTMRHPEIPRRPAGHVRGHGAPRRHRAPAAGSASPRSS